MEIAIAGGVIFVLIIVWFRMKIKRDVANALEEKGALVGKWTVYYDVPGQRIGLKASFGEEYLLRFFVFRLVDLLHFFAGMKAQQREVMDTVLAAARNQGATWQLLFPPPPVDLTNSAPSPEGKLVHYFDGQLYEGEASQPSFIGGDAIAKQAGLFGECIALAGHLAQTQPDAVRKAVEALVRIQEEQGDNHPSPFFWRRARAALNAE